MTEVDVLVAGGGPAGLLMAASLAARWRVALIERERLGQTTKYWVATERRLKLHGLGQCILHRPTAMSLGTFLGGNARAAGDFAVVDDRALLRVLIDRCRDAAVLLSEQTALLSIAWTDKRINAQTSSGSYATRLIIDATGGLSPIAATFRLHRLDGFYAVYGALLRDIDLHTQDIVLAHVEHLGHPPPILEVIPCSQDTAYCAVFTYSPRLSRPETLEAVFREHCSHNRFFSMTTRTETVMPKMGAIPIGRFRRGGLPGVAAIGEAALVQPPLLGTAFNEILEYCKPISNHLSEILAATDGIPTSPNFRYPVLKRVQDCLQREMARILLRGNVEDLDRLTRFVASLPEKNVYGLCSNELTWSQVLDAAVRLIPHVLVTRPWPVRT